MSRPSGTLDLAQQNEVADIGIALLGHLQWWGTAYTSPKEWESKDNATFASTTQAVVQLLARVTKNHAIALRVLGPSCSRPSSAAMGCVLPCIATGKGIAMDF